MPVTYAEVEALLRLTEEKIKAQVPKLNDTWLLFDEITSAKKEGNKIVVPLIHSYGHGAGPTPVHGGTSPEFSKAIFTPGYAYLTREITKEAFDALNSDPGSYIGNLDSLLALSRQELYNYLATMLWTTDGSLAKISLVNENVLTILPLVANESLYPTDACKYFWRNMYIDIYSSTGQLKKERAIVLAVDYAQGTIEVDDAGQAAVGDLIYWYKTKTNPPPPGLPLMIGNTGVYGGIDREEAPWWRSPVFSNPEGLNLSRQLIDTAIDEAEKLGRGTPEEAYLIYDIITTNRVREKYFDLMTLTYQVNAAEPRIRANIGIGGLEFTSPTDGHTIRIHIDRLCPEGTMWFICKRALKKYIPQPFKWTESGLPGIQNFFHYMGVLSGETNLYRAQGDMRYVLFTNACGVHAVIKDIKVN